MDRRVKERLIGAAILVAVAVLVVPELLSGPSLGPAPTSLPVSAPEPTRTVTVDLATSKASPASSAASPATAPPQGQDQTQDQSQAPAQAQAQAQAQQAQPNMQALAPVSVPKPSAEVNAALSSGATHSTLASSSATDRAWAAQIGSFASEANADKVLRQLKAQGYAAYVSPSGVGSTLRYRVRVGPLGDREAAAQMVVKLKGAGFVAAIVPAAA